MGRKRTGKAIHGWIAIDKPLGMSSAAVVASVRRLTGAAKVGHGGTLDPLASGVLPIALGEATKTVAYVMDGSKSYLFTVAWGEERSTDDAEGEVKALSDHRPGREAIEAALASFLGAVWQVPPSFSAVKVAGRRAYDRARSAEDFTLEPRLVQIHALSLVDRGADWAAFELRCGKGTYVRSLARDLARSLGTVGYVSALRRTACGPFREEDAISLDMLEEFGHSAPSAKMVLPVETALDDIPALALTEDEARRLQNGQSLPLDSRLPSGSGAAFGEGPGPFPSIPAGSTVRAMAEGRMVALARIEHGEIRPIRVLNL